MKNKKLLMAILGVLVLGGLFMSFNSSTSDLTGSIGRIVRKTTTSSKPVRPTPPPAADLNAGVQSLQFTKISSYISGVNCMSNNQDWQVIGRYSMTVAAAPFKLNSLSMNLAKLNNNGGLSTIRMANNYRFTVYEAGRIISQVEMPAATGVNSLVNVTFPGVELSSGHAYELTVEGKTFQTLNINGGQAKTIVLPLGANANPIGVFSNGSSYQADASVPAGNVLGGGTNSAITVMCGN